MMHRLQKDWHILGKKNPIKTKEKGFPGGAVVENLPANAGGHGFEP